MIIIIREYLIFRSVPMDFQEINKKPSNELESEIFQVLEPEPEPEQTDKEPTNHQVMISIKLHDF